MQPKKVIKKKLKKKKLRRNPRWGWKKGVKKLRFNIHHTKIMASSPVTCMCAKSLQSRSDLCNAMVCSPSGSSVHRILQARILEWVAVPSSMGSSWPRDQTRCLLGLLHWEVGFFFTTMPPGKPPIPSLHGKQKGKKWKHWQILFSWSAKSLH